MTTHPDTDALRELLERIRGATGANYELDCDLCEALAPGLCHFHPLNLTSSLDACAALMREVLPDCIWVKSASGGFIVAPEFARVGEDDPLFRGHCKALATDRLTFIAAILSAVIAKREMEAEDVE